LKSQEKLFSKSFSCGVRGNALQIALQAVAALGDRLEGVKSPILEIFAPSLFFYKNFVLSAGL
jgi:hypothetical protein